MKKKSVFKKVLGIVLATVALVVLPLAAAADWSPERPIKEYYPGVPGFDHVTFNSFVKTANYGDERLFYTAKDAANTNSGGFDDSMQVHAGQEILMRTYIHNGADTSLNAGGTGIARNTKVKVLIPSGYDKALRSVSYISASNAQPGTVAASVDLKGDNPFGLQYVAGSAMAYSNQAPNGFKINDSIVGDGALVGNVAPDGNVPGCFENGVLVTMKVRVTAANLSIQKQVGIPGSGQWKEQVQVGKGDTVSWGIHYENTGDRVMHKEVVTDKLPPYHEVVPGSVKLYVPNAPEGAQLNDTSLFNEGVMVGDYAPGAGGNIRYQTRVKQDVPANLLMRNVACIGSDETQTDICDDATTITPPTPPPTPECLPGIPVGDSRCNPVTPPPTGGPLPATGVESGLAASLGMTALTTGGYMLRRSRKDLKKALTKVK